MPGLEFFIGTKNPYYPFGPIDYEAFPIINKELRYAKCYLEVFHGKHTSFADSYVFGRNFFAKFNAVWWIDRTNKGELFQKLGVVKGANKAPEYEGYIIFIVACVFLTTIIITLSFRKYKRVTET